MVFFFKDVFKGSWLNTEVALKRLKDEHVETFNAEAGVLKMLNFPNVVKFYGLFQDKVATDVKRKKKRDIVCLLVCFKLFVSQLKFRNLIIL